MGENLFDEKAKEILFNHFKSCYEKIDVTSGMCRFNFQCHMNAVHDAIYHNDDKIAMCIYIDCGCPIIHFIRYDKTNNLYIDNTLGNWSKYYDYYLIRYLSKSEFEDVNTIFIRYRRELRMKLPFWVRAFSTFKC